MDANPEFHTSIEQIENLIKYSKESNYHWEYILLSGGEPLLWENLVQGTKLLYESGITSRLILLTNGLAITELNLNKLTKVIKNVHEFRISKYSDNHRQIELAQEYFGHFKNKYGKNVLNVVDRQEHLVPPKKQEVYNIGTTCTCSAYAMNGSEISYCGPAQCIKYLDLPGSRMFSRKITSADFLNDLSISADKCMVCISNAEVARTLKKEKS